MKLVKVLGIEGIFSSNQIETSFPRFKLHLTNFTKSSPTPLMAWLSEVNSTKLNLDLWHAMSQPEPIKINCQSTRLNQVYRVDDVTGKTHTLFSFCQQNVDQHYVSAPIINTRTIQIIFPTTKTTWNVINSKRKSAFF